MQESQLYENNVFISALQRSVVTIDQACVGACIIWDMGPKVQKLSSSY